MVNWTEQPHRTKDRYNELRSAVLDYICYETSSVEKLAAYATMLDHIKAGPIRVKLTAAIQDDSDIHAELLSEMDDTEAALLATTRS